MLLEIKNLSKKYNKETFALNDISFTVREGEFIAILGSSGAGKSTLIRCINRLVEPTGGEILWGNENILGFKASELRQIRRQVGMIFQNFFLIERMSVLHNVLVGRFGALPLGRILTGRYPESDREKALEALRTVGMEDFSSRRVSKLSGGQRQRIAIARALVQNPRLILGDEPVASLDPVTAKNVMELLQSIRLRDHMTMIVNLHSVELAKSYATRVIGIEGGRVVFDGLPDELTEDHLNAIYLSNETTNPEKTRDLVHS